MSYLGALLAGIAGVMLGLVFPDIDMSLGRTPFGAIIQHRSLLTHGFIISLVLFGLAVRHRDPVLRLFTMGFSIALATHLCFDLFPSNWIGTALIYAPVTGRLQPTPSILWMLVSIVTCLGVAFALVRRRHEVVMVVGTTAFTFFVAAMRERAFWTPLLLLVVLAAFAWVLAFTPLHQQGFTTRDRA
ncbi:MAG TPA: hypothetical protein VF707_02090 [Ardenticatenaceae bacterium]|jgi:hypothetical protein